jgi:hypothetical protein
MKIVDKYHLGRAWAGNAVNCAPYRQSGLQTTAGFQFGSFYDHLGRLTVFQRNWADSSIKRSVLNVNKDPLDAHFSPSAGIDDKGRIHIIGGAHASAPFYFMTSRELNIKSLSQKELPRGLDKVSYPGFLQSPENGLFLLYRTGYPARSAWRIHEWDQNALFWSESSFPIVSGISSDTWPAGPYLNTPLREWHGRFGFFLVWRTESVGGSRNTVSNMGIDYFDCDMLCGSIKAYSGAQLPTPVTPSVSERVLGLPWRSELSNQAGGTRLLDGRPFGAALWGEGDGVPQVHVFWPEKTGRWRSRQVSKFQTRYTMEGRGTLYLPHSRPVCAALPSGAVAVIYRTAEADGGLVGHLLWPPDFVERDSEPFLMWKEDLGAYEPVIDLEAAYYRGLVSLYVQRCEYGKDNHKFSVSSCEAYVVDWSPGI